MDYESKILLNNLVSSTDFWTIVITAVNALIMVWLGWNQYKLQKRQTKVQEYDIYRKLYTLLSNANNEIDKFLEDLFHGLWEHHYKADKNFLQRKLTLIDNIRKDLSESYIDYELKFSKDIFNKDGYLQILSFMSQIIQNIISSVEKNEVRLIQGVQSLKYEEGKEDESYASAIANRITQSYCRVVLMRGLESFIQQKKVVRCDNALLDKIRKKCKID